MFKNMFLFLGKMHDKETDKNFISRDSCHWSPSTWLSNDDNSEARDAEIEKTKKDDWQKRSFLSFPSYQIETKDCDDSDILFF
jgi:hypothetical protein